MKIVLLRDVRDVGRAHDVVEVRDGHALHFLIPRGLATAATPAAVQAARTRREQNAARRAMADSLVHTALAALADGTVVVHARLNEQNHLYDAVGAPEIAMAVRKHTGIDLPEDAIRLERPFKEGGRHLVPVAYGDAFGSFSISIENP